ncbi:uncharacterized protein [Rutidosis leptorrhynchoides]|uniref:uncharacterized protein n=1 Tax=Rutidosis leptorrhynchoides TaxID=125765 RepID=UPI003A9A343B
MREFFAYKIQEREIPTLVHLARKLQQQLLVDAYTMVESERIYYIRKNKKLQRADTFSNLTTANLLGDVVNSMLGNRVKLPSSFTGCTRYMLENYRDAMALCRIYTRLSFKSVGYRMHTYASFLKLPDAEDIDEYIWAELPDKDEDPELYQLVSEYLFKYIHKDNDRVTAGVCDEDTDEIKQYYDCRYVSSCEAVWRMLAFDINHRNPTVIRLAFHLEDQNSVIFDESQPIEDVLDDPSVNISQFLEWMEMNEKNNDAKQLTYVEFPTKFVWNKDTRLWSPRKVFTGSIGRIHHVSPQTGELFFLWILLNKVKGSTCYEDIRTVNGIVCPTFKAACYEMGLLDDDQEYIEGIKEAGTWGSGNWLRSFFARLLLSESLSRLEDVFEKCFDYLAVDIIPQTMSGIQPTREMIQNLILNDIQRTLQSNGKSLSNYSSMPIPTTSSLNLSENPLIIDELSYDMSALESEHIELIGKLNSDQKIAYETIKNAVNANNGGVFFLYGYGGTGKTFLWKTLSAAFRSVGEIVINVASSGIAALLLSGGRTAHSRFAIPIDPTDESFCRILPNSNLAALIRRANLII